MTKPDEGFILGVAGRLFREKGFGSTTVREIAAAAELLPGSLHYRYRTKEDLLVALMERGMQRALTEIREAVAAASDPSDRIRQAMRAHLRLLVADDDAIYVLLYEWRSLADDHRRRIVRLRDSYESLWDGLLYEAVGSGQLRPGIDLKAIRLFVLGAMNWTAQWFSRAGGRSSEEIADLFWALLGSGIHGDDARPAAMSALLRTFDGDGKGSGGGGEDNHAQ
jgi:AcrR family transcriptional regulator